MANVKPIVAGPYQFQQLQAGDYLLGNTPPASDNSTKYATTAYVDTAVAGGGGGISDAPSDGKYYGRRDGAWEQVGQPGVIAITSSITLTSAHLNKVLEANSTSNLTLTIPAGLGAQGDMITVVHSKLTGKVTVARGSGVQIWRVGNNADRVIDKYGMMTFYKTADANIWTAA